MDTMIGEILDSELVDSTIYTKVLDSGRIWLMILSFPMFRVSDPYPVGSGDFTWHGSGFKFSRSGLGSDFKTFSK